MSVCAQDKINGVDTSLCNAAVRACESSHERVESVGADRGEVGAGMVVLATGMWPHTGLAAHAGVTRVEAGTIAVDGHLRTDVSGVFVAGDCAERRYRLLGRPAWVPLGTTANKQGRTAGRNAARGDEASSRILGTAITRVFELEVAPTGFTEGEARAEGLNRAAAKLDSRDHAGYMQDAEPLNVKLVAERETGRLLGAQAGRRGQAHRRGGNRPNARLTVEDLTRLDLEYAPPFNGVWNPLQVAAITFLRQLVA